MCTCRGKDKSIQKRLCVRKLEIAAFEVVSTLVWLLICCEPPASQTKYWFPVSPIPGKGYISESWNVTFKRCGLVNEDEFQNAQFCLGLVLLFFFFSSKDVSASSDNYCFAWFCTGLVVECWAAQWQLLMCLKHCSNTNNYLFSLTWEACCAPSQHQMGVGCLVTLVDCPSCRYLLIWVHARCETKMALSELCVLVCSK